MCHRLPVKTWLRSLINWCTCHTFAHMEVWRLCNTFSQWKLLYSDTNKQLNPFSFSGVLFLISTRAHFPELKLMSLIFHQAPKLLLFPWVKVLDKSNWNFLYQSFHWLQACILKAMNPLGEAFSVLINLKAYCLKNPWIYLTISSSYMFCILRYCRLGCEGCVRQPKVLLTIFNWV